MAKKADTGITLKPTPGTTPEQVRDARARAWAFVFETAKKKAAERGQKPGDLDAEERSKNDSSARLSIHDE